MIKVYIPHYMAEEIRKHFGSLENYSQQRWGGRLMPVDDYWDRWDQDVQNSVNEKLSREWKRA